VRLVLDEARRTLKHLARPHRKQNESFETHPLDEVSLEDSFDANPFLDSASALRVSTAVPKEWSCVLMVDCSSSMSGEKHLRASIAVAVALLQIEPKNVAVVVFHSSALVVKRMGEPTLPEKSVLSFLRSRPKGFTNTALGLGRGLEQACLSSKRRLGLIATDGRHTEGKDPNEVARGFDFLVVLHLHGPGSSLDASKALASAGNGICLEVEEFSQLPNRLNQALKRMSRL
jgi:Mg-chelatase subunit ChlD